MGTYTLPVEDPNAINPYSLYGYGYGPYSSNATGLNTNTSGMNWSGTGADISPNAPMEDVFASNRGAINTTGNVIGNEAAQQLSYYSPLQQQYQGAQNQSLNQLEQTPGFTPQEADQIGVDYSQFNTGQGAIQQQFLTPEEQAAAKGNPGGPVDTVTAGVGRQAQALDQGTGAEGAMLNQYQQNLGGQVDKFGNAVGGAVNSGTAAQGAMLNQYQSELGAQLGAYGTAMGATADQYGQGVGGAAKDLSTGVRSAEGGLSSGLDSAQGKFAGLDQAVSAPGLAFDPNNTEQQMTDADVQNMRTEAGVSAGNQFRTAEDTLESQAAQAGNSSPAALAAMRQQLVTQQAATAGDVENQAEIAAKQAQYNRAAGIEQQRLGASQTQAGMKATAATTEEAAAQAAAGLSGSSRLAAEQQLGSQPIGAQQAIGSANINAADKAGQANIQGVTGYGQFSTGTAGQMTAQQLAAQEAIGTAGLNAAQNYGQFSTTQANTMTQQQLAAQQNMTAQQYQAETTAEQQSAQRAAALATNRQAAQTQANQMQYQQGVGSQQATSTGAQTTGAARIAGEGASRTGVAQQQQLAQQGGQQAVQQQLGAYGTQTSGANASASGQAGFEVGKASGGDTALKALTGLFDQGGVADHPMVAKLAEHGPEMVIPLNGRYRSQRPEDEERFREAA